MRIIKGGITAPQGYQANGIFCGIKRSGKPDLGLIYCEQPAVTVDVIKNNRVIVNEKAYLVNVFSKKR